MKIKNNKGGMLASDWVMAAVIFSGVIALLVLSLGSMVDTYNVSNVTSDSFSSNFDKFTENTKVASDMWNQTSGEGGLSLVGTADILFFGTFKVIALIFDSISIASQQIFTFGGFFNIPSEITDIFALLIFSILAVSIVFIIISSVRSGREL